MPKMGINMPKMGTKADKASRSEHRSLPATIRNAGPTSLADALFTSTQQRVLGLLFGQTERSFFANELISRTGSGSGAVQRELKRLASSGLVTVQRIGNQKHYQANSESPVFDELRRLVVKTVAMVDPIRRALEPLAERIELALLYGSVAKGTDTAASDIDILIVAEDLTLEDLYSALTPVEKSLQRSINPTLYTPKEFRDRKASGNAFIARVLSGEHVVLMGDTNESSTVGQSRRDRKAQGGPVDESRSRRPPAVRRPPTRRRPAR
jgi:predicted nucleotidyltransferase/predicted transcriptional regulator